VSIPGWTVVETEFDPARLTDQETVYTIGNGYLGIRGTFEEGYPGDMPATLIHGIFDDAPRGYTELANCPNWLPLTIVIEDEHFGLDRGEILDYERRLDLRGGVLTRMVHWRSPAGRGTRLAFERFASLADPHLLAIRCQITPEDFEAPIEIRARLHGYPDNEGLLHWNVVGQEGWNNRISLHTRTRQTQIDLVQSARLDVRRGTDTVYHAMACEGMPTLVARTTAQSGETITVTKLVAVYTSHDAGRMPGSTTDAETIARAAQHKLDQSGDGALEYDAFRDAHVAAWDRVWEVNDIVIEGDPTAQLAVRYNMFQILIAAPRGDDPAASRVSIPAKALSGFGYRGHVFWDTDTFIVPFLTLTQPRVASNLLTYRYHTLPGARRKARAAGYEGALFAWESALSGDEVTPRWVAGPQEEELVRIWCGDIELHINVDVAYATWQYWCAAGDDAWMARYGAEIILDTAVYWGSRVEWNADHGRFQISDVIGPDEYHEHVDNNAFTNRMVRWHLQTALEVLRWLHQTYPDRATELIEKLDLMPERLEHWRAVIEDIYVPYDPETGLFEQFEGFFKLEDVDLAEYEPRTRSMQAVLGIEGANERQVLKQPDVLMLLYLLRHVYDRDTLRVNWDYYASRTDHTYGSSLGPAIHASLAAQLGRPEEAYEHFTRAALVDLGNVRGNVADGIHAASAGGLWQALVFGFGGVQLTADGPQVEPRLPPGWDRLKFGLKWRGQRHDFELRPGRETPSGERLPVIRGVIFDLDGVLTDTSEYHYLAWQRMADEEELPFDRKVNEKLRGVSRAQSLRIILAGRGVSDEHFEDMMERKNRYYQAFLEGITPDNILPGAMALLEEVRSLGLKVAIGSASKNTRTVVDRLEIDNKLDVIADGYSVERPKPRSPAGCGL
jgi:beta-phosphoglucomutase